MTRANGKPIRNNGARQHLGRVRFGAELDDEVCDLSVGDFDLQQCPFVSREDALLNTIRRDARPVTTSPLPPGTAGSRSISIPPWLVSPRPGAQVGDLWAAVRSARRLGQETETEQRIGNRMQPCIVTRRPDEYGTRLSSDGTGNARTPVDILRVLRDDSVLEHRCDSVHELWTNWTASGDIDSGGHGH